MFFVSMSSPVNSGVRSSPTPLNVLCMSDLPANQKVYLLHFPAVLRRSQTRRSFSSRFDLLRLWSLAWYFRNYLLVYDLIAEVPQGILPNERYK